MKTLPQFGQIIHGGHFHGVLLIDGRLYGEVTLPKAQGLITDLAWLDKRKDVPGAAHGSDGLANTVVMAEAGSKLAQAALALGEGCYLPAKIGALLQLHNLKSPLAGGPDAFDESWHWTSTQYSAANAFGQYFHSGLSYFDRKDWDGGRARAVRRFLIE